MKKAEQAIKVGWRIGTAMKCKNDQDQQNAARPNHAAKIAKKLCHDLISPYFGPPPIDLITVAPHVGLVTGFGKDIWAVAHRLHDYTLDELRPLLAAELPRHAAFDGWSEKAVENAAVALGVDPVVAALAFANKTAMIDAWFSVVDQAMLSELPPATLATMKIRARITALVEARLAYVAADREALRRALTILAMPQNLWLAGRLGWRAANTMWRAAGDTATDYNHYSKRAILGSVYAATLAVFIDDESDDHADTRAFLARRIEGIMRFEKAKAQLTAGPKIGFSMSRFLGQLRYPAG
jgi:ubiquinone biosynthesis protein COQ9